MRDIMEATGVSSGALHHHFRTKDALALAVIRDRVAPTVRDTWIDPVRLSKSIGKGVADVFAGIIRGIEERGTVTGCPLNNLAMELSFANPQFRAPLEAIFKEWQVALADRIGRTRGGARLDGANRTAAAAFVIATYSGAMNLAKTTQSTSPLRATVSSLSVWFRERDFVG
jgi:AcrR family transcriptional regulator